MPSMADSADTRRSCPNNNQGRAVAVRISVLPLVHLRKGKIKKEKGSF